VPLASTPPAIVCCRFGGSQQNGTGGIAAQAHWAWGRAAAATASPDLGCGFGFGFGFGLWPYLWDLWQIELEIPPLDANNEHARSEIRPALIPHVPLECSSRVNPCPPASLN